MEIIGRLVVPAVGAVPEVAQDRRVVERERLYDLGLDLVIGSDRAQAFPGRINVQPGKLSPPREGDAVELVRDRAQAQGSLRQVERGKSRKPDLVACLHLVPYIAEPHFSIGPGLDAEVGAPLLLPDAVPGDHIVTIIDIDEPLLPT